MSSDDFWGNMGTFRRHIVIQLLFSVLLLLQTVPLFARELTLGIYAYRDQAIMQQRYQPLVDYLNQKIAPDHVSLKVLPLDAFQPAIDRKQLDFVFTNPRHYIILRYHNRLSGAIATLIKKGINGKLTTHLGGVIFTLKSNHAINTLQDLKNKTIATPSKNHQGGFQCQAYELLKHNINIMQQANLFYTGSHNKVIQAVLSGKADVGFIRTEILEELQQKHQLELDKLKIINPKQYPDFPFLVSTQLCPEWPFVALQHVNKKTVSKVAAALLMLDEQDPAAIAANIGGFAPPADYLIIEESAKALHLPPYDHIPRLDWKQIWQQHETEINITLFAFALILLLLALLYWQTRKLKQSRKLQKLILDSAPDLIWLKDTQGIYLTCNPMFSRYAKKPVEEIIGKSDNLLFDFQHAQQTLKIDRTVIEQNRPVTYERWIVFDDSKEKRFFEITKTPLKDDENHVIGILGLAHDITERKHNEEKQRIISSVFNSSQQSIFITDENSIIIEANPAACKLTGYSREELVGQSPQILSSGKTPKAVYKKMWKSLHKKGRWSGEIQNKKKNGELYTEFLTIDAVKDEQGNLLHYVAIFSDISYQKKHQQQLEFIAYNDPLTKLPNRVLLSDRLQQALSLAERQQRLVAVAYLDLDGFKPINDKYGHAAGDKVLITIANRLRNTLRKEDTVARLGGDEFVLLIVNLHNIDELEQLIHRIIAEINLPLTLDQGSIVQVSASIGITLSHFDDSPPEILLRYADFAMYQAKQSGKNRYCFFESERHLHQITHNNFKNTLKTALLQKQFRLYYQPKVDMSKGTVVGLEALIRWQHPEKGLLLPGAFLPEVENSGLICDIGDWVLQQAFEDMSNWKAAGLTITVSVNIASLHLQQKNFISKLKQLFTRFPEVSPLNLELEILESVVLQDIKIARHLLNECRNLGIKLAIDDFGSGYSSLAYLKQLPVDTIKIDRSFIRDILLDADDVTIVNAAIGLSKAFGRTPLAEGVESYAHGKLLLNLGCKLAQGFVIARPMPADQVIPWVENYRLPKQWQMSEQRRTQSHNIKLLDVAIAHNQFIERVLIAAQSRAPSLLPEHIDDVHYCTLGQWLHNDMHQLYADQPVFQEIIHCHNQVHSIASSISHSLQQNKTANLPQYCKALNKVRVQLIDLLHDLYSLIQQNQ